MPLDKAIDSQRLDNALHATADAIRQKSGSQSSIPFDMDYGFSDAIGDIPAVQDPGDWTHATKWMSTLTVPSAAAPLPDTITIDATNWGTGTQIFRFPTAWTTDFGYRHIIVKNSRATRLSLQSLFHNYYPPRKAPCTITFEDGVLLANSADALTYIGYNSNSPLPEIYGEIDLSYLSDSMTPSGNWCLNVGHIEFKHNSCTMEQKLSVKQKSSKAGLTSLANALHEGTAGKLTLLSYNKTDVTDKTVGVYEWVEDEQCYVFTQDADGDTTLTQFITDVKGWTIAT